jgi:hypothetical protein
VELVATLGYRGLMEIKYCEFYIFEAYHPVFCMSHSPSLNICYRHKEGRALKQIHICWLDYQWSEEILRLADLSLFRRLVSS